MPVHSKPENFNKTSLNPMVFYARFPHISEKIFENLNIESLKNCRKISKSWLECIDNPNILRNKIAKIKAFQFACEDGNLKMVVELIQKSAKLSIDMNYKERDGLTAFQSACYYGNLEIVDMLVQKSAEFEIDFNIKDGSG